MSTTDCLECTMSSDIYARTKEVYFDKWCPTCAHVELGEEKDPCHECLNQGWNIDSHKPVNWEEANAYDS